jgi:branched-chain amino acid transport system substrate-binding protein
MITSVFKFIFQPILSVWRQSMPNKLLTALLTLCMTLPMAHAEPGVTADTIVLGQSTSLTGPLAELGIATTTAERAYFDYINAQGGVHGRKIKLISVDDAYNPEKTLANTKTLIEKDNVFALFNVLGTPNCIAVLPLIEKHGIPHIAPYSGAQAVRKPHNRLVFHVRASYHDEVETIVEHLGIRGITEVAVVYQNNSFGKDGYDGAKIALEKRKLKIHAEATIENNSSDVDKAAATLAATKPGAIIMITSGVPSAKFIKAYNKLSVGMQFFGLSVLGTQTTVTALGKDGVGVVVAQVTPFPFSVTSGIIREYQMVMKKMGVKDLSFISMEGFINAKVAVEGLRRAGRDLTRERLVSAMESIGRWDMDGYLINLTKNDHNGSRAVELTVISKDGRFLR